MLTGPIDATQRLLERTGLAIDDIDTFEINEAFASVVLAWAKEVGADLAKTNPNGGAIALGHPLGGTGAFLDDQGPQRARAQPGPLRPDLDVLRRRPRHRHDHRTPLTPSSEQSARSAGGLLTALVLSVDSGENGADRADITPPRHQRG